MAENGNKTKAQLIEIMFDIFKPEVSGLKSVLNGYFAFKNQSNIIGDVPVDRMDEFADWYYSVRLGQMGRGSQIQTALTALQAYLSSGRSQHITIVGVLLGLLAAEGMSGRNPNTVAMGKVFDKFPSISPTIRGL